MAVVEPVAEENDAPKVLAVDATAEKREALIYLGGLNTGSERKSVTGVVARLTRALDTRAATRSSTWRVEWSEAVITRPEKPDPAKPLASVFRKDAENDRPVLDVFEYRWSPKLMADWEGQSLFRRAFRVLFGVVNVTAIWRRFGAARKSVRGWAQLAVATLMLLGMALYAGSLAFAVYQTAAQVWESTLEDDKPAPTTTLTPASTAPGPASTAIAPPPDANEDRATVTVWQRVAILGGFFMAGLKRQGDRLRSGGGALFAADDYIRLAGRKQELMGDLRDLCEKLAESPTYTKVRVVGYSFGAIVALDALFPTTARPAEALGGVNTVATIGAPYDFVRAVRPSWSSGRHTAPTPSRWINVYSPIDLLGSNFREDNGTGDATRGLTPAAAGGGASALAPDDNLVWDLGVELTFMNLIVLKGFSSHGDYWGDDGEAIDDNVFDLLVPNLFAGSDMLA